MFIKVALFYFYFIFLVGTPINNCAKYQHPKHKILYFVEKSQNGIFYQMGPLKNFFLFLFYCMFQNLLQMNSGTKFAAFWMARPLSARILLSAQSTIILTRNLQEAGITVEPKLLRLQLGVLPISNTHPSNNFFVIFMGLFLSFQSLLRPMSLSQRLRQRLRGHRVNVVNVYICGHAIFAKIFSISLNHFSLALVPLIYYPFIWNTSQVPRVRT